jgi:beta-lactamase regulating signal transducer with metallopeptidase domain
MMDLEVVLRTSALLLCASLITRVLIKATPATRHLIWHAAIVVVLVAPALMPLAPRINWSVVESVETRTAVSDASEITTAGTPAVRTLFTLATVSAVGSSAVGLWFLIAWFASGWKVRQASPAPREWVVEARAAANRLGMTGSVEIRQSVDEGSPQVAGFFRSVVLVPPSARHWTSEDRQAALVHELTHIRRGDRRTQALAQLACAVYWFNPLVWHASAALARERERACDAEVLRLGARPSAYATLLLDLARSTRPAWTASAALSMARPSAIEGRLLTILGTGSRAPWRTSRWMVAAGVVLITGVVLGAQLSATQEATARPASTPRPRAQVLGVDDSVNAPEITDALVGALSDTNAQVREKAALGLAFTPGADVIDPLLTALRDSDGQVREKAAIGLAFRRDPRIVSPLITAMSDDDSQVREKAAIALGASGDSRALAALQRAVHDPDSQVREKAVAGLLLLGSRK